MPLEGSSHERVPYKNLSQDQLFSLLPAHHEILSLAILHATLIRGQTKDDEVHMSF